MLVWILLACIIAIVIIALLMVFSGGGSTRSGGRRTCPMCGATLGMDERVFADQVEREDGPHELTIKGCSHCYDRSEDASLMEG